MGKPLQALLATAPIPTDYVLASTTCARNDNEPTPCLASNRKLNFFFISVVYFWTGNDVIFIRPSHVLLDWVLDSMNMESECVVCDKRSHSLSHLHLPLLFLSEQANV